MGVGLDPEGLVVGEVQAELVELEVGHLAQPVLDPVRGEVLAGYVEVEPALRFGRGVAHGALRGRTAAAHLLLEGAGAVEHPGLVGSGDADLPVAHGEGVRLGRAGALRPEGQLHVALARGGRLGESDPQLTGQQLALVRQGRAVGRRYDDPRLGAGPPAGAAGRHVFPYGRDGARGGGQRKGRRRRGRRGLRGGGGGGGGGRGGGGVRRARRGARRGRDPGVRRAGRTGRTARDGDKGDQRDDRCRRADVAAPVLLRLSHHAPVPRTNVARGTARRDPGDRAIRRGRRAPTRRSRGPGPGLRRRRRWLRRAGRRGGPAARPR